jgi:phospholipase/lecithinase/hemolysin
MLVKSLAIAAIAVVASCLPSTSAAPSAYGRRIKHMAVFGDSYSDTGNVYKLSHGAWPLPHPYFHGRFTNGPTWSEHVRTMVVIKT